MGLRSVEQEQEAEFVALALESSSAPVETN